jgi:hypothetical protein
MPFDIRSFGTANGRTITVKRDWGPTERELAETQKNAAAAVEKMHKIPETAPSIGDAAKKRRELVQGRLLKAVLRSEEALQKSEAASGKTEAHSYGAFTVGLATCSERSWGLRPMSLTAITST